MIKVMHIPMTQLLDSVVLELFIKLNFITLNFLSNSIKVH